MARPGKRERERERRQRKAERRAQAAAGMAPPQDAAAATVEPVRGAFAAVIDDTLCWHLARTKPLLGPLGRQHLDEALKEGQVRAYRPRASEVVVRRGRRVVRHVPLLIRTLIIGVRDRDHLDTVAALPGVAEIVSHPEDEGNAEGNVAGVVMRPARLDPVALQGFMIALAAGEIVRPVGISVGEQVVVMTGSFASFPAVVEAILPGDRIKVAVSIFGRPSPVELGIADVQRV
ncbi:hypothetical protein Q8W71_17610 [Methylobacterium sp. NEAU 140]|uniref:transcription termination/antitermination protein NusG n=1 Tax=Methylobacterium sp. NEAU 140 TaxID=3064945 RepID=UPI002734C521|nr:hypothetical protein [Methylobacterium sp. NEAU 140]MDP4024445.1 hypothetical protein [Methylobacterium sp. NEAU 140]